MIYPWDISRFREALDSGLPGPSFERFNFSRIRIGVGGDRPGREIRSGQTIELQGPAAVFGTPAIASCLHGVATGRVAAPAARVETIENAMVVGLNAILDPDGRLHAPALCLDVDDLRKALAANRSNAEGYVLREEEGVFFAYFFSGRQPRRIQGTALFLSNLEIGNYGSFLIRVLPQLLQAKSEGRDFDAYISADRSAWLPQAIAHIGLPNRPIFLVHEVCGDTFDRVITHVPPCVEGLFDSTTITDVRRLAARTGGPSSRRLYVSRQLSRVFLPHYRQLLNEAEVVERFTRAGFEIVFPETLSFVDQIRLFSEAKTIAGPSGSGLLNAIFSSSSGKVLDIEGFNVTVRQHAKVYSSSEHPYGFCFGRLEPQEGVEPTLRPWTVDLRLLDQALEWLET